MSNVCGKMKGWLTGMMIQARACLRLAQPYRKPLLLAAGIGVAAGAAAFFAGPWFAAAAGCLAGFATTISVQSAIAFRRLVNISI